jgi:hypothetical protein
MKLQRRNKGFCGECKDENFCREMEEKFSKDPLTLALLPQSGEGRKMKRFKQ